jgi:adenylosuccinate synthase
VETSGAAPPAVSSSLLRAVGISPLKNIVRTAAQDWIAYQYGEREHGSCGYGSWSATDRINQRPEIAYTIKDFLDNDKFYITMMRDQWNWVVYRAAQFGIEIDALPQYKEYFEPNSIRRRNLESNFNYELHVFYQQVLIVTMDDVWRRHNYLIFENGQGLGLDKDVDNEWHTTSSTGLTNPYRLIADYEDFNAEVCYTTCSYLTRHGLGPMESEVEKRHINSDMIDRTNVPNEFQGNLRYGYYNDVEQKQRIAKDWLIVENDKRFTQAIATTHCNEFQEVRNYSKYYSDSPFVVKERD